MSPESPKRHAAVSLRAAAKILDWGRSLLVLLMTENSIFYSIITHTKRPFPASGICLEANIFSALRKLLVLAYLGATVNGIFSFKNSVLKTLLLDTSLTAKFIVQVMLKNKCHSRTSTDI